MSLENTLKLIVYNNLYPASFNDPSPLRYTYKVVVVIFSLLYNKEDIIKTNDLTIDIQDKIIKALQEKLDSK